MQVLNSKDKFFSKKVECEYCKKIIDCSNSNILMINGGIYKSFICQDCAENLFKLDWKDINGYMDKSEFNNKYY